MPKKIVSRATRVKIRLGQIAAQEKKATEAFNKVMHEPVTLPELDIKKFLAEFEAEPDNAWMMGSGQPFSDWVENVIEDISLMAGLRTRLTKVQALKLPNKLNLQVEAMVVAAYTELVLKHYPTLDPDYVAPPKPVTPYDPFDL